MKRNFLSPCLLGSLAIITSLSGCKSTMDLNPQDDSTVTLSAGAGTRVSDRIAFSGEYSRVNGSSTETFSAYYDGDSNAIQIDGERFVADSDSPLKVGYDFSFNNFIVEADIDAFQGDFYTLTLSPGISYFHYDLDVAVSNQSLSVDDNGFGFGAKLDNQFKLNENLTLNFGFSIYDNDNVGNLYTAFAELRYALDDNWELIAGYRQLDLEDEHDGPDNDDGCTATEAAENCEDSEVSMGTKGITLGVFYRF